MTFVHGSQVVRLYKAGGAKTSICVYPPADTMADMTSRAARSSTAEEGKMINVGRQFVSLHRAAAERRDQARLLTGAR